MVTVEVQTVIYLRARIAALHQETPVTRAGRESLAAAIADLERDILKVRSGGLSRAEGTV